jgi:hypothetical protein
VVAAHCNNGISDMTRMLASSPLEADELGNIHAKKKKLNSVALVRERTIPTERPPLVGEVSDIFC